MEDLRVGAGNLGRVGRFIFLTRVITPTGFSVNAVLCVESPKYNCGCRSGKSCFLSFEQAQAEIKRFRSKRSSIKIEGRYLSPYRCACSHFHVGNHNKTVNKRRG